MNGDQNNRAVFDRAAMLQRLLGDESLVEVVLERFLSDTPRRIAALGEALARDDAAQSRLHAHTIKSAAANINAAALSDMAAALETAAETDHLQTARDFFPGLREQFDILKQVLGLRGDEGT